MTEQILIRKHMPNDLNFIYSTWLRGIYYGNEIMKDVEQTPFFKKYAKIIERIIEDPETLIHVAVLSDDPNIILGYAAQGPNKLHYVFVKDAWRKMGIAKKLITQEIKIITHMTDLGKILRNKIPAALFNPFMI